MAKKISIIITCYKLDDYLKDCVECLDHQTVKADEIIVIHDGCENPKIYTQGNYYIREANRGVARARKEGFLLSNGDYILFLDADDVLPENYIEQMKLTLDSKNVDIAYPSVLLWSNWNKDHPMKNDWFEPGDKITFEAMKKMNHAVVTSMMKRKVYETVGDFDPTLELFEDYDFWMRALVKGFKFRKAKTFLKYRLRQKGRNQADHEVKVKVARQIVDRYKNEFK